MLQFELKLSKFTRMGITIFKIFICGGKTYVGKSRFTATLARCRKTKFPNPGTTLGGDLSEIFAFFCTTSPWNLGKEK